MKLLATRKDHQNRAVFDPWSVVHFSMGLAAGLTGTPRRFSVSAAVAYEFLEQALERHRLGKEVFDTAGPESVANAVADVAVFVVGQELGRAWNRTGDEGDERWVSGRGTSRASRHSS